MSCERCGTAGCPACGQPLHLYLLSLQLGEALGDFDIAAMLEQHIEEARTAVQQLDRLDRQLRQFAQRLEEERMGRENLRLDSVNFTLLSYVFKQYLVENNLTTEDAGRVVMAEFYEWLQQRPMVLDDRQGLAATYGITPEEFDFFEQKICSEPFAFMSVVNDLWPMLTHGHVLSQHYPQRVKMILQFEFADRGLSFMTQMEPPDPKEPMAMAHVASMVRRLGYQISRNLLNTSLEEIYAQSQLHRPPQPAPET